MIQPTDEIFASYSFLVELDVVLSMRCCWLGDSQCAAFVHNPDEQFSHRVERGWSEVPRDRAFAEAGGESAHVSTDGYTGVKEDICERGSWE